MNSNRFAAIFDSYRKQFQEAQAAGLTRGLSELDYIKLSMAAEAIEYQEITIHKLEESEKSQPKIAQLQKELDTTKADYLQLQQQVLAEFKKLNDAMGHS